MRSRTVRTGVALAATGCIGLLGAAGAGATGAKTVGSDSIAFTGPYKATAQGFTVTSTQCALKSDAETKSYNCNLTATITNGTTGLTGNATVKSADGTTQWTFTLTPNSTGSFTMKGSGKESDRPDKPGQPVPKPYPCTVTGSITPNTAAGTASGSVTVSETPTAP